MSADRGSSPTPLEFASVREFLSLRYLPGRLCDWQTAAILGFETHHIPILVAERHLKTSGNPPHNAPKYFSRDYVLRLAADERWLARASDALVAHWAKRNARKKERTSPTSAGATRRPL